jgi:hypothetical protein
MIVPCSVCAAVMARGTKSIRGFFGTPDVCTCTDGNRCDFSTTNKFYRDHHKEPVVLGPLLTDASRGLAMHRQLITDPDIRVPIPSPIVQELLLLAHQYYRAITWQPDNLVHIKNFRAILAVSTTN